MTDTIKIYDERSRLLDTVNGTSATLVFDDDGYATYDSSIVGFILAELDSSALTILGVPETANVQLYVQELDGTAIPVTSGAPVTGGAMWTRFNTYGVQLVFTTPTTSGDQMDWFIGEDVPAIRLTVKIKRR
jgi:hypothetical protein